MRVLAIVLSGMSLLMSILLLVRLTFPWGFYVLAFKLAAGALSPFWVLAGVAGAVMGWMARAPWTIPMGMVGAGMMTWYVWRCARGHTGFEDAFGAGWDDRIPPGQTEHMTQRRWTPYLRMKASPEPTVERDVVYGTVSGTERQLLCDVWRPANGNVSGLVVVYLHGGAWYYMDKGQLGGAFFRHLAAQGHTVVDVGYRLCPEVDMKAMIGDVKRAVAWTKADASRYGVDPDRIVLAGASSGGHLALLAGYAPQHPDLTPADMRDVDLSVCGVVSYYGPTDMEAEYRHASQQRLVGRPPLSSDPDTPTNVGPADWRMDALLGGWPEDASDAYELASPVTHVSPGCPPTLLIQGDRDLITPVDATCELHAKLVEAGVPAVNVVFPWTDHAFDVLLPQVSPPAQSALYDVDRFLALLTNSEEL